MQNVKLKNRELSELQKERTMGEDKYTDPCHSDPVREVLENHILLYKCELLEFSKALQTSNGGE